MYFHTAGFAGAKTDSTANENIPAVADPTFNRTSGNLYLAPTNLKVFAALAANDTIARARITSPSLRQLGLPELYPLNIVAEPTVPVGLVEYGDTGPEIRQNDEFGVECSNGASTIDVAWAALWLRKRFMPVPSGKRFTMRATATITLVASAWALGTLTFDQTPPVGDYSVIGLHVFCADAWFARLVFPMDTSFRPGVVTQETLGAFMDSQPFRYGRVGEFGRFHSVNLPQIEVLGHTAGAEAVAAYIDMVQLSA